MKRFEADVIIDHFQYQIVDAHDAVAVLETGGGDGFGMLRMQAFLVVRTGTPAGVLQLAVEVHDVAPALDVQAWDDVVDVSVRPASGQLAFYSAESGAFRDIPAISLPAGDWCRVRVHARGRDTGAEIMGAAFEPVEAHLVQIWPANPEATIAHKLTDVVGEQSRSYTTEGG